MTPRNPTTTDDPSPTPRVDRVVFGVSAFLALAFVGLGLWRTDLLSSMSSSALGWLITNGGWAFVLVASGLVVFALWLAASRYGRIPLGADGESPEFKTMSWVAMMFSAGMGIGLMFYGVSEPLAHFAAPPPGTVPANSDAAVETAMATSLFHWTLHPWAIYAVVGLAIAYSGFRRGRSQLISSVFAPLLGERKSAGPLGKLIDVLAIFATLFGSAASLGLGTLQIGSGLRASGWLPDSPGVGVLVAVIGLLTVAFVASAVSGVAKGIQWLSNTNMVLAAVLAVFLLAVGPTVFILGLVPSSIGSYFRDLAEMTARTGATGGDAMHEWLSSWTIFYWAWWISWTPFVGMFIARISRGRTIRQFVCGAVLVPATVSVVWFAIFGGAAIDVRRHDAGPAAGTAEAQLFDVLAHFPWGAATGVLVMVLVAIFFVSGADAASVVMGTLSQCGSIEPRSSVVVFWGVATGAVAAVLLIVGGGGDDALAGLQNLTIIVAAPFTVVIVVLCVALAKDLRSDPLILRTEKGAEMIEAAVRTGDDRYDGDFQLQVCSADPNTPDPQGESDYEAPNTGPGAEGVSHRTLDAAPDPGRPKMSERTDNL
ncbi:choline/carnitine/betaine transport [Saccharopolyspora antimicrobica]|uniref:Choline/carnitine/betaine transport n=1 Tax=Saccharopolyspora antimicrobica TaxID=455193 RepID=A0A1I5CEG1_9PSEU|nr:BCCT family transporter [Saccharopolyspora antimicrobica]RKT88881.1 choline/carnitine/betaine transport [Saccharopolyspora antimicrobica]SFN85400.1 choline/carnitine/betaine transport [Saccharopolyspora antimicrobica]